MSDGIMKRLKRSLTRAPQKDDAVQRKIMKYFQDLGKSTSALPGDIAQYVIRGDNTAILLTLQDPAIQEVWTKQYRSYDRHHAMFDDLSAWQSDQMRRMGEVLATLAPISYDWGRYGTQKSPPWLRYTVTLWLGGDRKGQTLDTLLALTADEADQTAYMIDILLHGLRYHPSNSFDHFTDVPKWLSDTHEAVIAASRGMNADSRVELATAIGRFGLHAPYLTFLIDGATGSAKKARIAARQALTGADPDSLAALLRQRFADAAPGQRAELVEVAAVLGRQQAATLLAEWREHETVAKVIAALDRVASAVEGTPSASDTARPDGPEGYTAVDGSWVETPARKALPEPSPVPAHVLQRLIPAREAFRELLAEDRRKDAAQTTTKHWHWSRGYKDWNAGNFESLAALAEGSFPVLEDGKRQGKSKDETGWLNSYLFKHPSVDEFFNDPGLTLYHLVRLSVQMRNGRFDILSGEWQNRDGAALRRRLDDGADIRTVLHLWKNAGGNDPIKGCLTNGWFNLEELNQYTWFWPILCEYFAQLDEALGMVPQSGAVSMQMTQAFHLLTAFPKLPGRYGKQLLMLANDSSSFIRKPARCLLAHMPDLGHTIAIQLQDGRQETRALAADWLAERAEHEQIPALHAALTRERGDLARAAMITALERLGEDVSVYFEPAALLKEAKAGLARPRPKGLEWLPMEHLPALHWADGTPVDPLLPQWWLVLAAKLKQPGGNALMHLWLDRLAPEDAHRLGWLVLAGWIDQDTRTPTEEEANAYANANADTVLQRNIDQIKRWPQGAAYYSTDRAVIFADLKRQKANTYLGNATSSKGILALAARVNGADAAQRIRAFLKDHGQRTAQARALLDVLGAIGTPAALQALLAAANRTKQRSVQAHAGALVEQVADRNGWSAAQLADRTIPTGGFDPDGMQDVACGAGRTYRLRLDEHDAVVILNADGKEVKSLPAARTEEERPDIAAAKKQLSTARKEVKQALTVQTERLQEAMYLQRDWGRDEWQSFIAGHPIIGRLAARLIWQGVNEAGEVIGTFRPLGDGSFTDAADNDVTLADFAQIRLAHSLVLHDTAIAAWRQHLADYAVKPPFDQILRDLPSLTEAQAATKSLTSLDDREGWMIEAFKLRSEAGKLGYQRSQAEDGGWFVAYLKTYRDAELVAEIEFTGSSLPEENHLVALQSLSFRQLSANGRSGRQVTLDKVPPVLLAESWRDLHDIADKGTGFDPKWKDKT